MKGTKSIEVGCSYCGAVPGDKCVDEFDADCDIHITRRNAAAQRTRGINRALRLLKTGKI